MKPIIEKWFTDAGFNVQLYEVHSKNADKDKEFWAFKADNEDGIKLCLSVNMLAEGIHGDIDGVIMLRNTISANMYFQMIGRAFACGKKTIPLIIDLVANSQFISDAANLSFPNELRGEIEKRKKECEKEGKEYDPGFDVDEFIVMDEFMDVVSGFRAIEERLIGSWDLYIKALKQYKEREGDCDVPYNHVEVVDGVSLSLGKWCCHVRIVKNGNARRTLTNEKECQLKQFGFIWDIDKYRFENKVNNCIQFYKEEKRLPNSNSVNKEEKEWGVFLIGQRQNIKNKSYPQWKVELLNEIPDFYKCNSMVDKFYEMAIKYKNENGHVNIKVNDVIENYNIGIIYNAIKQEYKNQKLSKKQIRKLQNIGINLLPRRELLKNEIIRLSNQAVKEGYIISSSNPKYKGKDLYNWYLRHKQILDEEENQIFSKLIYFRNKPKIAVKDVIENKIIGIYISKIEVGKALYNELKIVNTIKTGTDVVYKRLTRKSKKPYKGRFMFYYTTDEEVKKYLEDSKVN